MKLELARVGLFLTLGNITPRFLLFDLGVVDDVAVIGVVELAGLFEGDATDDIDVVVDKGGAAVGSVEVAGTSVAKSSVTLMYLRINDVTLHCEKCLRRTDEIYVGNTNRKNKESRDLRCASSLLI